MSEARASDGARSLPPWLEAVPADRVVRIDAGLEGRWSETVTTVWRPDGGVPNLADVLPPHPDYRQALELYLDDCWIGVPCSVYEAGRHRLDEEKAQRVIAFVVSRRDRTGTSRR